MSEGACPFCERGKTVLHNNFVYAIYDANPVTPGHLLIIPMRHVANYFEASVAEKEAMWTLVERAKQLIEKERQPAGYNLGINVGEVAGQTIAHAHLHLIPRYRGDTPNPRGGVRGTTPGWPSRFWCGGRPSAPRRTWLRSCCARAPASTVPCRLIGSTPGDWSTRGRASFDHRYAPPCC